MRLNRGWITGALVALTLLSAAGARAQKVPAPQVDDSRSGQFECRRGNTTMRLAVPAGHLAEVRGLAAQMGYSASDCVFAAIAQTSPAVVSVEGTVWTGTDSDGDSYTWRFLPGGNVNYTSPSGTFSNCTWQQQGARVTWGCNNHYSDYGGTIAGNQLNGTARNVASHTWSFSLTRQPQP